MDWGTDNFRKIQKNETKAMQHYFISSFKQKLNYGNIFREHEYCYNYCYHIQALSSTFD